MNNFADFTDEEFHKFYSNPSIKNYTTQKLTLD